MSESQGGATGQLENVELMAQGSRGMRRAGRTENHRLQVQYQSRSQIPSPAGNPVSYGGCSMALYYSRSRNICALGVLNLHSIVPDHFSLNAEASYLTSNVPLSSMVQLSSEMFL